MSEELAYATVTELLDGYRDGTISPVEATKAALTQIEKYNGALNAFVFVDEDYALARARESEARWRAGTPVGRIDGVPTTIKDILLTEGWPTLRGSLSVDAAGPWNDDAPCVARLKEHGAVILGKTTTPEFGWKGVTDSPRTGITRNPWNKDMTPGGSSGGASAACAAGMGGPACGNRWRRLDPYSQLLCRYFRHQAELWPGTCLAALAVWYGRPCGADVPHRARCGDHASGDERARCTRLDVSPAGGYRLPRRAIRGDHG